MKVERKSGFFEPVVITIETEKELMTIWGALGSSSPNQIEDFIKKKLKKELVLIGTPHDVYCKVDQIVRPE